MNQRHTVVRKFWGLRLQRRRGVVRRIGMVFAARPGRLRPSSRLFL
jgi:hypothetical protein